MIRTASLDLGALHAFLALARSRSIQGAARETGMSRATLRRRVAELEATVGMALHERGAAGVSLTTAGEELVVRAPALLVSAGQLLAAVRESGDQPLRQLRVLVPVGLPPMVVGLLLAQARAELGGAEICVGLSEDPLRADLSEIDFVLHFGPPPSKGSFVTRLLIALPEGLRATRAYLDEHGVPESLDALADHNLLTWMPPGEDPRLWPLRDGGTWTAAPMLLSPDIHLVRQSMLAGTGIARIPDRGLPDLGWDAEVVPVLPERVGCERSLRILIPEGLHRTPRLQKVLAILDRLVLPG